MKETPDEVCHFAAWEQPELFVGEMRAGFKSLRSGEVGSVILANDSMKALKHECN